MNFAVVDVSSFVFVGWHANDGGFSINLVCDSHIFPKAQDSQCKVIHSRQKLYHFDGAGFFEDAGGE